MKVKVQNFVIQPALQTLDKVMSMRANATLHQRLLRNARVIQTEFQTLAEAVNLLNDQHVLLDDEGNKIQATEKIKQKNPKTGEIEEVEREIPNSFKLKSPELYAKEYNELMNEQLEIDIVLLNPAFLDSAGVQLTGQEYSAISFMIKEVEDDDES